VVKGDAATAKYGQEGIHGVVEITSKQQITRSYEVADERAKFPAGNGEDGQSKLAEYLAANIKYPAAAKKYGIEGMVVVRFVVDEKGSVTDVSVVKALSPECDAESVRVVAEMSKKIGPCIPATKDGKPIASAMHIPIKFKLQPLNDASKMAIDALEVSFYPNPVNEYLMINLKGDQISKSKIVLLNVNGQVVQQMTSLVSGLNEIDMSTVPNGEYILQVSSGDKVNSGKVIVQR
jgi:TonB family protein